MNKPPARIATLPPAVNELLEHYAALTLGGKRVVTPYFMNQKGRKGRRVSVGKGTPRALERETRRLARRYRFDVAAATPQEIRAFMMRHRLGIDCSGLVSWALCVLIRQQTGRSLWRGIWLPGNQVRAFMVKRVRPVENISVRVLTHENNATTVASLGEVLPGDIIRTLNGNHVLLVSEVGYGKKGNPLYIKYINSTEYAGIRYGIRVGVIVVTEPTGHILQQEWIDGDADSNLTYKAAKDYPEDTRIVRLKLLHTS